MAASRTGTRTSVRRRQRSVRVTVAVALLATATVVVLVSLTTRSVLWLSIGAVLALALSWAALRMMWTEVLQSRRENAADRAAAAAAYVDLFTVRAASLDDPARYRPQLVSYGVRGHPWDRLDPDLPKFDRMPPR